MNDGMIVVDAQGRVADINPAATAIMHLTISDVIGKAALDILRPWPRLVEQYGDRMEAHDEISIGEDDAKRWFELHLAPLYDRRSNFAGRVITLHDITQRKLVEERIDRLTRQQEIILENIPVGVALQKNHKIVWGNNRARVVTGYSADDIDLFEMLLEHPEGDQNSSFAELVNGGLARGEAVTVEVPLKRKDGIRIWANIMGRAINPPDLDDEILWVVEDITSRRQAQEQMRLRWRALEASPASIVITNSAGSIQYVNPKFVEVTGYSMQEAISQNPRILKSGKTPPEVHRDLWQTITSGREWRGEFCNRKKNGDLYWELASISPLSDTQGKITHYVAVKEDITEQRKLREQLRERNESLSMLHQFTLDLLDVRETDELLQAIVARAAELLDAPFSQIILKEGDNLVVRSTTKNLDFLRNEHLERDRAKISWEVYDTASPVVLDDYSAQSEQGKMQDGLSIHGLAEIPLMAGTRCLGILSLGRSQADYSFTPEQMQIGILFCQLAGLVLDNANLYNSALGEIRERKRTEALLQESEARYRQIVESASDIIYRTDPNGYFNYANPTAFHLMGFQSDADVLGRHFLDLAAPDWRNRLKRFYDRQYLSGQTNTYYEFPVRTADGQDIWLGQNVQIIRDGEEILGFQAVARNINDIKQAQEALAIARDQALEASRLKSKLLASVSHELRTPLSAILGYAELLHENAFGELSKDQRDAAGNIIESTNYLASMINELLDEAQIEAKTLILKMEPGSPRAILERVETSMSVLARSKGLTLTTSIAPDFPNSMICDERRLQQILINLIANAIKFTKKGGVRAELSRSGSTHWCLQVSDTGVGILEKDQVQIFEPFHKVNSALTGDNRGTGLGLSITKQLVDLMEGQITLKSKMGSGSTFTITLPFLKDPEDETPTKPFALVIEDDPKVGRIFEATLREAGFETDIDMEGNQIFDKLSGRNPALFVLDLHLPSASGLEILNKIRSEPQWAQTPVIIATADLYFAKSLQGQVEEILIKPVSVARLRETALRLLQGSTEHGLSHKK